MSLIDILSISIIRDEIMKNLIVHDSTVLLNTIKGNLWRINYTIPKSDVLKYIDISKEIIPNKRWKNKMLQKGYTLTIVDKDLTDNICSTNTSGYNGIYGLKPSLDKLLVLTSSTNFVALTEEIAPIDIFYGDMNKNVIQLPIHSNKRCIRFNNYKYEYTISCLLCDESIDVPVGQVGGFISLRPSSPAIEYFTYYCTVDKRQTTVRIAVRSIRETTFRPGNHSPSIGFESTETGTILKLV